MKKIFITFILVWCATMLNAQVKVLGKIEPNGATDTYPTHADTLGRGGLMAVGTWQERNSIPRPRRKAGMLVRVKSATVDSTYTIGGNLTNADWTVFATGGGTPSNMVTTNTDQIIGGYKTFSRDITSDQDGTGNYSISLHNGLGGWTLPGLIMKKGGTEQSLGFNANSAYAYVDNRMPPESGTLATQEWVTANTGSAITNLNQIPTRSYNDLQDKPAPVDISGKENTSNKVNSLVNPNPTTYPTTQAVAVELIAKANLDGGNVFSAGFQEIRGTNLFSGLYLNTTATTGSEASPSIKFRGKRNGQDRYARMQTMSGAVRGLTVEESVDGTTWRGASLQAGSGRFTSPDGTSSEPTIIVLDVKGGNGAPTTTGTGFVSGGTGSVASIRTGDGGNNSASNPSGNNFGGAGGDITFTAGNGGTATGGAYNFAGKGGDIILKSGQTGFGSTGLQDGIIALKTSGDGNSSDGNYVAVRSQKGLVVSQGDDDGGNGSISATELKAVYGNNLKLSSTTNTVEIPNSLDKSDNNNEVSKGLVIKTAVNNAGTASGDYNATVNGLGLTFSIGNLDTVGTITKYGFDGIKFGNPTVGSVKLRPDAFDGNNYTLTLPNEMGILATQDYVLANLGKLFAYSASGDGSTTEFTIPHGLTYTPKIVLVTANSNDATISADSAGTPVSLISSARVSGSNIIIKCLWATGDGAGSGAIVAPKTGTNNLTWTIMVK